MKILGTTVLSTKQPRMVEFSDKMVINGHVYDKTSLTPDKMSFLEVQQSTLFMLLNTTAIATKSCSLSYDNVIQDQYNPNNTFVIGNTDQGASLTKIEKTLDGKYVVSKMAMHSGDYFFELIDHDALYIYVKSRDNTDYYIRRYRKSDLSVNSVQVVSSDYCKINVIHKNETDIYFALSYNADKLNIYRYQRYNYAITLLKQDQLITSGSYFNCHGVNDTKNSLLIIRNEKSFNGENRIILKRYIIDGYEQKVYDKTLTLDCSILPSNKIVVTNANLLNGWRLERFVKNNQEYLILYEMTHNKKLYLLKKTRENEFTVIQEIATGLSYNSIITYNNCRTLIFCNDTQIGFYTFSEYEERYELTHSESDLFDNIGIDRSQRIWIKNKDHEVTLLSENNPIKAEVSFEEKELDFNNINIETKLQAYAKSFTSGLIVADIEIMLSGPVIFTDTKTQKKTIKTSSAMPTIIPVTITGPGLVEASANII